MKNLSTWLTVAAVSAIVFFAGDVAFAAEADNNAGYVGLASGLAIGLAVIGGGLGQGNAAASAYESIARNPQAAGALTTPFFVGMALIESLVIYALVIAFFLQDKITL
ncbi:MAG: ATP synthase F0 subunit C [Myxococcota bacterium]